MRLVHARSERYASRAAAAVILCAGLAVVAAACQPTAPQLTRYPYLTDSVGTSVTVNWGTDRSDDTGSVKWGAVDTKGTCTLTKVTAGTWFPITVNGVSEYQWLAILSLPTSGRYRYRPYLAFPHLLGPD